MMMKGPRFSLKWWILMIAVGLALALAPRSQAVTINWGDSFGGVDIQSDGSGVPATFTFEIGVFEGFVPDETNAPFWSANWTSLDSATYNTAVDFFSSSFQLDDAGGGNVISSSTGASVPIGEQVYIWIYNTDMPGAGTQWALLTDWDGMNGDDWLTPNPGDQQNEPIDWRVSLAISPVFGGANNTRGQGSYSSVPPVFDWQTATFVPEPSSALLVVAGAGLLGMRRRRG